MFPSRDNRPLVADALFTLGLGLHWSIRRRFCRQAPDSLFSPVLPVTVCCPRITFPLDD